MEESKNLVGESKLHNIEGNLLKIADHDLSVSDQKVKLFEYVSLIDKNSNIPEQDVNLALQLLADYECWEPFSTLSVKLAKNSNQDEKFEYYLLCAKAWGLWAHDLSRCADVMLIAIKDLEMEYDQFMFGLYLPAIESENYQDEAVVLEKIVSNQLSEEFLEPILERLAMIYDKKLHLDVKHHEIQERLLNLNPNNHKSLRYFKIKYQQAHDWDNVSEIIEKLIETSEHGVEKARYGMELAVVYLYYLNNAERALEILDSFVGDSFDSNKIRLATLQELAKYKEAIEVLDRMLEKCDSPDEKAVILYHYGQILYALREYKSARAKFKESYELQPNVTTLQEISNIHIKLRDIDGIRDVLNVAMQFSDNEIKTRATKTLSKLSSI